MPAAAPRRPLARTQPAELRPRRADP